MKRASLLVALALCAGCATSSTATEAPAADFEPTGTLQLYDRSASFDATRVVAGGANLSRRADGSWAGFLNGQPFDVSVTDTHLRGANIIVSREMSTDERCVITGNVNGQMLRFELDQESALVRTRRFSVTLRQRTLQQEAVAYGPRLQFVLKGEASKVEPPWPQFALALIAAFQ